MARIRISIRNSKGDYKYWGALIYTQGAALKTVCTSHKRNAKSVVELLLKHGADVNGPASSDVSAARVTYELAKHWYERHITRRFELNPPDVQEVLLQRSRTLELLDAYGANDASLKRWYDEILSWIKLLETESLRSTVTTALRGS
jgi:hypothetical protein